MADQVQENDRRARFVVTDPSGQAEFDLDFPVIILEDFAGNPVVPLNVYQDGVLLSTDDWTYSAATNRVTLDSNAPQNSIVTIDGYQLIKRTAGYPLRGALRSAQVNFDQNVIIQVLQEMRRDIDRALLLNPADPLDISNVMALAEAGKAILWNATGDGFVNGPTADDIENAQGYAADAAASAASLSGTSASSVAIGTGSKAFTTQAGKAFTVGRWVLIASNADPSNYMHGQITAYSGTSLTVNVTNVGGSGTLEDWTITISGTRGAAGADGANGTNGTNGADGADGEGVIAGGATDDILGKDSATDYDTKWIAKALEADAIAGTDNAKWMTALRTKQLLDANTSTTAENQVYVSTDVYMALASTPVDNSIPQITEGSDIGLSALFALSDENNLVEIEWSLQIGGGASGLTNVTALFMDSTADAVASRAVSTVDSATHRNAVNHNKIVIAPGTTDEILYALRSGNAFLNGDTSGALMGDSRISSLTIREITPETFDLSGFDTATQDLINASPVRPSLTRVGIIDDYFTGLKTAGLWAKLDWLYLGAEFNQGLSLINAVNPGTADLTRVSSPIFVPGQGWKSDGSGYLTAGATPYAIGSNYTQDSAHVGVYNIGNTVAALATAGTVSVGSMYLIPQHTGNVVRFRINDAVDTNSPAYTGAPEHIILNRPDSATKQAWRNAVKVDEQSVASSGTTSNLAATIGQGTANTVHSVAVFHGGAHLTPTEIDDMTTLTAAYLTAIGAI